jgi:polysaccharide biosynthesis/export protein
MSKIGAIRLHFLGERTSRANHMFRAIVLALAAILSAWGVEGQEKAAAPPPAQKSAADPLQMAAPKADRDSAGRVAVPGVPLELKDFIIGAEDVLVIRVWREPELSGQYVVRPDGKISLPLVNELQAAGLTPEGLKATIVSSLSRYINNPEVSISVGQVNSRKYYIQGEVNRPGSYPLVVPTTVLEALVNAGGFKEFANTKKIIILRGKTQLRFNYKDVTKGKHTEQNIRLEPGDQIIVK